MRRVSTRASLRALIMSFAGLGSALITGGVVGERPAQAEEILRTLSADSLKIDGLFHDWSDQRSASFEHHARHGMANRDDLRGRLHVALSPSDLHFLVELHDDDLRAGSAPDYVAITIVSGDRSGRVTGAWSSELRLDIQPMLKGKAPRVLRGRAPIAGASAQGIIWWGEEPHGTDITDLFRLAKGKNGGAGGLRVELSIPLSQLPPVKGQRVGIMGSYFDVDQGRLESVYSTEVSQGGLKPMRASWVLGGNAAYRTLYESVHRERLEPLKELEGDWVGDQRPESVYVTDADLIVLGADLPNRSSYAKWPHGWQGKVQVESMSLRRSGKRALLSLVHVETRTYQGAPLVQRIIELYHLDAEGLRPVFAQVSELKWGAGRAGVAVDLTQSLTKVTVSNLQREGIKRATLRDLPTPRGVYPVAGEDGKGRVRRYTFDGARLSESREEQ